MVLTVKTLLLFKIWAVNYPLHKFLSPKIIYKPYIEDTWEVCFDIGNQP